MFGPSVDRIMQENKREREAAQFVNDIHLILPGRSGEILLDLLDEIRVLKTEIAEIHRQHYAERYSKACKCKEQEPCATAIKEK